jgi:RNA polymerase sigma-70 factor (ECF subfamily)
MIGDRQEAEDIIQESFLKAFEGLHRLKDTERFGGWLRQIIINTCIDRIKKKIDFSQLSAGFDLIDEDNSDRFSEVDFTALHYAIKRLPDGCRQIFLLYVSEDYSHKQIASLLKISESTSKSQYARAKKLLKEQLSKGNG